MKKPILSKLLWAIVAVLAVTSVVAIVFVSVFTVQLLVKQADRDSRLILIQEKQRILSMLTMGDMTAKQIMVANDIKSLITEAHDSEYKPIILNRGNDLLIHYLALNPYLSNITIITWDDLVLSNQGVLMSDTLLARKQSEAFTGFFAGAQRKAITSIHQTRIPDFNSDRDVITVIYRYRDIGQNYSQDNYLMLDILVKQFTDADQTEGKAERLYLMNDFGQLLVQPENGDPALLREPSNAEGIRYTRSSIILAETIEELGWTLFYVIPNSEFLSPIISRVVLLASVQAIVAALGILFLARRINRITSPIHTITAAMQEAYHGNLSVQTDIHSGDEIEILSTCFNKLVVDLREYIDHVIEEEQKKKEMHMDLMLSQIHPHFIYNTLNNIVYLIEEHNDQDAIDMIYALIELLQNSVKLGKRDILSTVTEEIALVEAYTAIASMRYPNAFALHIHSDPRLHSYCVPRILIQPLVENALLHGIIPAQRFGTIEITLRALPNTDRLEIVVADDGLGIASERLGEILSKEDQSSLHGVGLSNIHNRLQFLYKDSYYFAVQNLEPHGTKITIRISSRPPELPAEP